MRLRECKSVVDVGKWLQSRGFSPGEHSRFGGVNPVHTEGSLHDVDQALDVNDRDVKDTAKGQFSSEHEALKWLYGRILGMAESKGWPLDEMFFSDWGYIKERGYDHNHPIGGHDGHLHVGFSKKSWR